MARWILLCLVTGCDAGGVYLGVDLKTDFVPEAEFDRVEVVLGGGATDRQAREVATGEPFFDGVRVAEFGGLAPGHYTVRVRLLDALGRGVAERPIGIDIEAGTVVTVLISRSCRGVACPEPGGDPLLTACLGGECVRAECSEENPEACGTVGCEADAECPAGAACALSRCVGGACLLETIEGACANGEFCDPETGCMLIPVDPDAGVPAGCATPCDDGLYCNGVERCEGSACVPGGSPCTGACDEAADRCAGGPCGVCAPGAEEWGSGCGNCGSDHRVCQSDCTWGGWSCEDQGECSPGSRQDTGSPCGRCGTWRRTCGDDCRYGAADQCGGQGSCSPGQEEWGGGCGTCQQDYRSCHGGCEWNGWECQPEPGAECTGGTRTVGYSCACPGWEEQEHCIGCRWQNVGCQNAGGGYPCGGTCSGYTACVGAEECTCSDGSWTNCWYSPSCGI